MTAAGLEPIGADRSETAALWCLRLAEAPLSANDQQAFADWLAADPSNRSAFEEAAATWRDFDGAESAPEFLQMRVEALRLATRRPRMPMRRSWALAAAAAIVVAAGAGLWVWATAPVVYSTGVGERRVAVLKDGSRISLDASTVVKVRYTSNRRDLELVDGRAKFDVAKDPLRPFSVAAADKIVVATGTEFSVERLKRQIHVILYQGHVAVLEREHKHHGPEPIRLADRAPADQRLTPGRELVVRESSEVGSIANTDPARALSWEAGQLVFVDEPLSSAVERVNRYSADQLVIGDPAAGEVRITGVFTAGDVQAFVEGVSAVFPVRVVERDAKRVFVTAPARG